MRFFWEEWLTEILLLIATIIFTIILYVQGETFERIKMLWILAFVLWLFSLIKSVNNGRDM